MDNAPIHQYLTSLLKIFTDHLFMVTELDATSTTPASYSTRSQNITPMINYYYYQYRILREHIFT